MTEAEKNEADWDRNESLWEKFMDYCCKRNYSYYTCLNFREYWCNGLSNKVNFINMLKWLEEYKEII